MSLEEFDQSEYSLEEMKEHGFSVEEIDVRALSFDENEKSKLTSNLIGNDQILNHHPHHSGGTFLFFLDDILHVLCDNCLCDVLDAWLVAAVDPLM